MRAERCETCRFWAVIDEDEPSMVPLCSATKEMLRSVFGGSDEEKLVPNTEKTGGCHRYPPTKPSEADEPEKYDYENEADLDERNRFPITCVSDWCGEWQPTPSQATHSPAAGHRTGERTERTEG